MKLIHFFTVALAAPLVVVEAQRLSIDYQIAEESTSEALFVGIHGSGLLDFSKLQIDSIDGGNDNGEVLSVQAAIISLDGKANYESMSNDNLRSAGLGVTGNDGNYYACCSETAVQAGACNEEDGMGQLIIVESSDDVSSIEVQSFGSGADNTTNGNSTSTSGFGARQQGVVRFYKTSHVALVFGNCQPSADDGATTTLRLQGEVTWKSYVTPGMLPIYTLMTVFYVALCLWYGQLMKKNKESRINVENWVFFTVVLATLNATLETVNFTTELYGSNEIMFFKITSLLVALARHSVTRCLYLVLSLGLGVATASLSRITTCLVGIFLATDLILLWAMHLAFYMNIHIDVPYSSQLVRAMEYIFSFWIPIALCYTMYQLKKHEEHAKLVRYKWFMAIYFLTATLSFFESMLYRIDRENGGQRFNRSTMREANDLIYLVPLACVAVLWRPNPNQQMYSYVLLEDDKEDEINDIELTEKVDDGNIEEDLKQIV